MARDSARNSAGKVEPDRIGKMHARRRELTVRAQLARRLRGFRGKSGRVGPPSSGGRRLQRVIVKTHMARHKPGKTRGSLTRHASYLGRDSASSDGKPSVFYEIGKNRFIVVRDREVQAHHGRVRDTRSYRDLHVGSVAGPGACAQRRQRIGEQGMAVARETGIYSAHLHEAYLGQSPSDWADR